MPRFGWRCCRQTHSCRNRSCPQSQWICPTASFISRKERRVRYWRVEAKGGAAPRGHSGVPHSSIVSCCYMLDANMCKSRSAPVIGWLHERSPAIQQAMRAGTMRILTSELTRQAGCEPSIADNTTPIQAATDSSLLHSDSAANPAVSLESAAQQADGVPVSHCYSGETLFIQVLELHC